MATPEVPTQTLRRLHDNTDGLLRAVIEQMNLAHHQLAEANHPYQKEIDEYLTEVKFKLMRVRQDLDYKAMTEANKIFSKFKKEQGDE